MAASDQPNDDKPQDAVRRLTNGEDILLGRDRNGVHVLVVVESQAEVSDVHSALHRTVSDAQRALNGDLDLEHANRVSNS